MCCSCSQPQYPLVISLVTDVSQPLLMLGNNVYYCQMDVFLTSCPVKLLEHTKNPICVALKGILLLSFPLLFQRMNFCDREG